jgi:hypothetical protein
MDGILSFIKGKITYLGIWIYDGTLSGHSMITKQQDIQENWGHTMQFDNIIGGPD